VPVIAALRQIDREAIELTRYAKKVGGRDACKVPTTTKPSQEGMFQHFKTSRDGRSAGHRSTTFTAEPLPIWLRDNYAGGLAAVPGNPSGSKDATGDLGALVPTCWRLHETICRLSGNDDSALALILVGGHGVISVTANVHAAPDERAGTRPRSERANLARAAGDQQPAAAACTSKRVPSPLRRGEMGRCNGSCRTGGGNPLAALFFLLGDLACNSRFVDGRH